MRLLSGVIAFALIAAPASAQKKVERLGVLGKTAGSALADITKAAECAKLVASLKKTMEKTKLSVVDAGPHHGELDEKGRFRGYSVEEFREGPKVTQFVYSFTCDPTSGAFAAQGAVVTRWDNLPSGFSEHSEFELKAAESKSRWEALKTELTADKPSLPAAPR